MEEPGDIERRESGDARLRVVKIVKRCVRAMKLRIYQWKALEWFAGAGFRVDVFV